jgi:hypothetical protein
MRGREPRRETRDREAGGGGDSDDKTSHDTIGKARHDTTQAAADTHTFFFRRATALSQSRADGAEAGQAATRTGVRPKKLCPGTEGGTGGRFYRQKQRSGQMELGGAGGDGVGLESARRGPRVIGRSGRWAKRRRHRGLAKRACRASAWPASCWLGLILCPWTFSTLFSCSSSCGRDWGLANFSGGRRLNVGGRRRTRE